MARRQTVMHCVHEGGDCSSVFYTVLECLYPLPTKKSKQTIGLLCSCYFLKQELEERQKEEAQRVKQCKTQMLIE